MGGFLNSITSPLGVKLFPGGPYADAGIGDQQAKQAGDFASQQQAAVAGYMKQIAPIIAEIAKSAGVGNPLTGEQGASSNDPYGLSALQQGEVNRQSGEDTTAYEGLLKKIKANLSARGLGGSSEMTAAESYLRTQLQSQKGAERLLAGQQAYDARNQAQGQIANLLQTGLQAKTGANTAGYNAQSQVSAGQKQTAEKSHADAMASIGNLLALGMYAGGVGPFAGTKAPQVAGAATAPINSAIGGVSGAATSQPTQVPNIYNFPTVF